MYGLGRYFVRRVSEKIADGARFVKIEGTISRVQ